MFFSVLFGTDYMLSMSFWYINISKQANTTNLTSTLAVSHFPFYAHHPHFYQSTPADHLKVDMLFVSILATLAAARTAFAITSCAVVRLLSDGTDSD